MAFVANKQDFPVDGSANERNNRLSTLINNTAEIGAGSETLDGIVFNYTNRADLISQLRTSLEVYLMSAANYNDLGDEFSNTAIVNKWETQTGLDTSQLPERDANNTFTGTNTFSSQVNANSAIDLNNTNLIDANQLRFNSGIWLRSNNNLLEFSSDSGSNWEVVGVPRYNKYDVIYFHSTIIQNATTQIANYTGSGLIRRIGVVATSTQNGNVDVMYSIDGGATTTLTSPGSSSNLAIAGDLTNNADTQNKGFDLDVNLSFETSFTISVRNRGTNSIVEAAVQYNFD